MVWNHYGHRQIPPSLHIHPYTHVCVHTLTHTVADNTVVGHSVHKLIRKQSGLFPCHTLGVFTQGLKQYPHAALMLLPQ